MSNLSILSGLDYYKVTMSQMAWRAAKDAQVTFTLKNRSRDINLLERVSVVALRAALSKFSFGFYGADTEYLKKLGIFDPEFLRYLNFNSLPVPFVAERDGELFVRVTGDWPLVTFWETVILSTINDLYFKDSDPWTQTRGHINLTDAIYVLGQHPGIKISDFGTRRRFSFGWQSIVVARMAAELPNQFLGTSNPYLAQQYGLKPIGTFAHEMPMVYGALAEERHLDPLGAHNVMLNDWYYGYNGELSIALTDTFGTDFFFATFGPDRARQWKGLRHDSGDPYEFGERAIKFYEDFDIDPTTKTIVFSDGLDLNKIVGLYERFEGRIGMSFGWGTGLTNNVGLKPLNIVMKATSVNGISTVKLSDDEGKHTGTPEAIARYIKAKEAWL